MHTTPYTYSKSQDARFDTGCRGIIRSYASVLGDTYAIRVELPASFSSAIVAACANVDARDDARGFGVSSQRLKQLSAQISTEAQSGAIPGAVILVARNGKIVYTDAIGSQDPSSGAPMKLDSIFRIASMTKPIVSVGAMILVEEGKLFLADPVS
jgi:CubicO group peptidase (beta-lactamase class C family)